MRILYGKNYSYIAIKCIALTNIPVSFTLSKDNLSLLLLIRLDSFTIIFRNFLGSYAQLGLSAEESVKILVNGEDVFPANHCGTRKSSVPSGHIFYY